MKGFAFVLLCALVAVQGRHTGVQQSSNRSVLAALGENPWVVHLRIAIATSGLLNTCAGSLIGASWVLTAGSCVESSRFIWIRYGVVDVPNPELVTETTAVRLHENYNPATGANDIGLININRAVSSTQNISPIPLAITLFEASSNAKLCTYGQDDSGNPGEVLSCSDVTVAAQNEGPLLVTSENDVKAVSYDMGSSLVIDGVQVAILTGTTDDETVGTFTATIAYLDWITRETGLVFFPEAIPADAPEAVRFAN